jgi:hypothetical protein
MEMETGKLYKTKSSLRYQNHSNETIGYTNSDDILLFLEIEDEIIYWFLTLDGEKISFAPKLYKKSFKDWFKRAETIS